MSTHNAEYVVWLCHTCEMGYDRETESATALFCPYCGEPCEREPALIDGKVSET